MPLTINAKTYNPDSYQKDAVVYTGALKTVSVKDDVRMARVAPKPVSGFSGVGRTSAKLTRTLPLTNAQSLAADGIVDVQVSVPVGFASADIDAMLNDMGAFVASASFKAHVKAQQVAF